MSGYIVKRVQEVEPVACPCGEAIRALTGLDNTLASVHQVTIRHTAELHYHLQHTEIYYVLEGSGIMELDQAREPLAPGTIIMIQPGTRHRAVGDLTIINIVIPPFDPADEYIVSENAAVEVEV